MRIHVVDHNSIHRDLIAKMIKTTLPKAELTMAKTHENHDKYVELADMVVISGGTWLVHMNPGTHHKLMSSLLNHGKPIFAICLGAEAVADFFGGKIRKLDHRQQGVQKINIIDPKLVTELGASEVKVYTYHTWAISKLPHTMSSLAESENGIEYFRHRSLPIWGTQFHPEARRGQNKGYLFFEYALKQTGLLKK